MMADTSKMLSAFDAESAAADLLEFAASDVARIPTGYSLDDTCGMWGPGEFSLLWARASAGKSTLYLNEVSHSPSVPTVIFNMEMTPRRQLEWLLPMTFDLETPSRLINEVLSVWGPDDARYNEIVEALHSMKEVYPNLHFLMPESPTVVDLANAVEDIADRTGVYPQRVIIDHLSEMSNALGYQEMTRITSALHTWAVNADLAVLALQHTGRGGIDGGRNDGHLPVTLSSGVFAGEGSADWIRGMYRPELDPAFHKQRWDFKGRNADEQYEQMLLRKQEVKGITRLQLIKNRPFGELRTDGIDLRYDAHSRRLLED